VFYAIYSRSLFERLSSAEERPLMLVTQYRMHREIRSFPSKLMYEGQLRDGRQSARAGDISLACSFRDKQLNVPLRPYVVIDTQLLRSQEFRGSSGSYSNEIESCLVAALCLALVGHRSTAAMGIGVITPYSDQKRSIIGLLGASPLTHAVEVDTVDGFQGREKDVVLLCCVRANKSGEAGFFGDVRRLNVALTRAKHHMFVIGDLGTLSSAVPAFKSLSGDARRRGCVVQLELR
jgi:senataxin